MSVKFNSDGRLGLMLTELRLPTIRQLAAELCDQSDREGWPARQLLERLFEHEMTDREVRRYERHRAASGLSPDKRLSSFDFSAVPTLSRAHITALGEGHEWLDRGVNPSMATSYCTGRGHFKVYQPEQSEVVRALATPEPLPAAGVPSERTRGAGNSCPGSR